MQNILEGNDKSVIQGLVNTIISGEFEQIHVREIFNELRDYSEKDSWFKEIANFIAHPERDKGKIKEYMISYSREINFAFSYLNTFDIFVPFPFYVLELIYDKINMIDRIILHNKLIITHSKLKKELEKKMIIDEKTKTAYLSKTASPELVSAIYYCLNQIGVRNEILNQNQVIDEIIHTLKNNSIDIDESKFRKQSNRIMICVLILLHLKGIQINGNSKEELPYCSIFLDKTRNNLYFGLFAIINSPQFDNVKITFPLIKTNLLVKDYCDDVLMRDISMSKTNNEITRPLQLQKFKLSYNEKSKKPIKDAVIFYVRKMNDGRLRFEIISLKESAKHTHFPHMS